MGKIEDLELGLYAHVGGGDDHWKLGLALPDTPEKVDPVGIRKAHIQDGDIRLVLLQLLQRLRACGGKHQIVFGIECTLVAQSKCRLVLNDQYPPAALSLGHPYTLKPASGHRGEEKLKVGGTLT
jgi:hypothetical protein